MWRKVRRLGMMLEPIANGDVEAVHLESAVTSAEVRSIRIAQDERVCGRSRTACADSIAVVFVAGEQVKCAESEPPEALFEAAAEARSKRSSCPHRVR